MQESEYSQSYKSFKAENLTLHGFKKKWKETKHAPLF